MKTASSGVIATLILNQGLTGDARGDRYSSVENLVGSNHNDVLTGALLSDSDLIGLGGDDLLYGGLGRNLIDGGDGRDVLVGDRGADTLLGGAGNDALDGGSDADLLDGGAGNDALRGGRGNDTFAFGDSGTDTILDYERGEKIDLSAFGIDASAVKIVKDKIFVDLQGSNDLTIVVHGAKVGMNDLVFAPAAGQATAALQTGASTSSFRQAGSDYALDQSGTDHGLSLSGLHHGSDYFWI